MIIDIYLVVESDLHKSQSSMNIICIDSQATRAKEVFWEKKRSLAEDKDLAIYRVEEGQGYADRTKVGYSARGN